jgi:hypothetical protein
MLALSAVFAVVLSTVSMPGDRAFGQMTTMNNSQKVMAAQDALEAAVADPDFNTGDDTAAAADTDGKITLLQRAVGAIPTTIANNDDTADVDADNNALPNFAIEIEIVNPDSTTDPPAKATITALAALTDAATDTAGTSITASAGLDDYLADLSAARFATDGTSESEALASANTIFTNLKGASWDHDNDGNTDSRVLTDDTKATLDGLNDSLLTATPADLAAFKTSVENALKSDGNWYPEDPPTALPTTNVAYADTAITDTLAVYLNTLFNPDPDGNPATDDESGALDVLKDARTAESTALAGAKSILEAVKTAVDAAVLPAVDKAVYTVVSPNTTEAEEKEDADENLATAKMLLAELVGRLNASNAEEFTALDEFAALKTTLAGVGVPSSGVTMKRLDALETALLKNNVDDFDSDDDPSNGRDVVGNPVDALIDDSLDHIIPALGELPDLDGTSAQKAAIAALDDVLTKVDAAVTATAATDDDATALTMKDADRLKAALDALDALKTALEAKHVDTDPSVDANSVADHRMALNMLANGDLANGLEADVTTAATALQADGDGATDGGNQPSDALTAFRASGLLVTALAENPGLTDDATTVTNEGVSVTTAELGAALQLTRTQTAGADTPDVPGDDVYEMSTDDYHATLVAMVALLGVDTVPDVAGTATTIGTQPLTELVTLGVALQVPLDAAVDASPPGKLATANAAAEAYRSETLDYNSFAAMAALQSALDDLDSATASDIDEKVRVAREALIAARTNKDGLTDEIQAELDTAYAELIGQGSTQHAYAQRAALMVVDDALADGMATEGLAAMIQSKLTTQSPEQQQAQAMISRIEASIRGITVSGGEKVRLMVEIYGLQDKQDEKLGDNVTFAWSVDPAGGTLPDEEAGNSTITYTSPTSPGTYTVTATLDTNECYHEEADAQAEKCSAKFELRVRRAAPPQAEDPAPVNPPGEIPSILSDGDGNNYEVFTPVEGGTFDSGEGYSITAEPGAVPNGEFIGVRMSDDGPASNVGMTHQRYTLGGNMYGVHAVDSSEASVSDYPLDDPATVCVPLPDVLRGNISDLALVTLNSDGSLTILAANVRIGAAGTSVCGNLSNLPASVAVGSQGAPDAIPTATPEPAPVLPDTGATAPSSNSALWALILGIAIVSLGTLVALSRRRNRSVSR